MTGRVRGLIAIAYLTLCILLGGASAGGAIANAILQGGAIIVILLLLWSRRLAVPAEARPLVWIVGLFLLVGLLSLVPLPAGLWQSLPYRDQIAGPLRLIGLADSSLPLSLAPGSTIASLLWLLPPTAMFLMTLTLAWDERRRLGGTVLVLAVLSIVLGVLQLLGGVGSPLRYYAITNAASPVGFFANINHQATLILCALPCAAVIATQFASRSDSSKRSGGMIIAVAFSLFLTAGIAISGSMAGYGLFIPAAFASLLIYRRSTTGSIGTAWKASLAVLIALFIGLAFFGPVSQQSLSEKFSASPTSRSVLSATTVDAIEDSFPVGTGLGTFSSIYRRYEDPGAASRQFVNHAHNDYLELVLELGLVGVLLILGFGLWWLRRSLHAWRSDLPGMRMAEPAALIIGIVLLHSLVDYPLRTSAIAAVFAVACAFLVPPPARSKGRRSSRSSGGEPLKHLEAEA
jgi:O-antigen ligase